MAAIRWISLTLLAITSATAQRVGYNYDREADFSRHQTYRWVDLQGGKDKLGELSDRNVKEAINKALAAKGLKLVDAESADLYIGYQVGFEKDQQYTTFGTGQAWGSRRGWGVGMGTSTTTSTTIVTGTLALDIYDAKEKKLVWRGTAADTIEPTRDPDKRQKKIDKGAIKLLKSFPPPRK